MVQVITKTIIRTLLFTLVFALVLIVGLVTALQIPAVQTILAQKAAKEISTALGFPVSIGQVHIRWFDNALFEEVLIADREENRMIDVPELAVDFDLPSLLTKGHINIDEVILTDGKVRLIKSKKDNNLNIDEFIIAINELTRPKDTTKTGGKVPVFSIDRVQLANVYFSYNDERKDSITDGFDYQHIAIDSIYANTFNFRVAADTIEVDIDQMRGRDASGQTHLDVKELTGFYRYTKRAMYLSGFSAHVGNSIIGNYVEFNYESPSHLSDFNDKITMVAHMDSTSIYSKDLGLFAPYLNRYEERWIVSGEFNGKVTRFRLKDARVHFGKYSSINGDISFTGLPNIQETFIDMDLQPSSVEPVDLKQYIPDASAYATFQKFGRIALKAKFLGFTNDFVANGNFSTEIGRIVSDVNLKLKEKSAQSTYSGKLSTYGLNIGYLSGEPGLLQLLDMSGEVKGKGLSIKDASLDLNATVRRLGLKQYDYKNMRVKGHFSRQQFKGNIAVRDTNLVLTADGEVDLRDGKKLFDIKADLQNANLYALKFVDKEAIIRTKLNVNFQGIKLDDMVGEALFTDSYVLYNNRDLIIDSVYLFASKDETSRTVYLDSDFASAGLQGNFEFSRVLEDGAQLLQEYKLSFADAAAAESYYQKKNKTRLGTAKNYKIDITTELKDINPLLVMFYPSLYVSKGTKAEGVFSNGAASIVSFNTQVDSLHFKEYKFYNSVVDITTSKLADSANVLAQAYIHSDRQQLGSAPATEGLTVEAIWGNKQIDFNSTIRQTASSNYASLKGNVQILPEVIELVFKPSHFQVLDQEWHIAKENKISFQKKDINFNNLTISNRFQVISVNGTISDNPEKEVELLVKEFKMQTLNPIIGRQLLGTANVFVKVKDFYKDVNVQSELEVGELVIDNFLIGDISGQTTWDVINKRIGVNYQVYRMRNRILSLSGFYDPQAEENALAMQASLNKTDLEILEPFFKEHVSNIGGTASGRLQITGMLTAPMLKGALTVNGGRFKYNYLNTTYHFNDKVYFSENEIGVRQLQLYDQDNNLAYLKGGVFHDGFRDFVIDLSATMQSFQVLNTTAKDNDLFYGTAYATGNLSILGSISNLTITANALSNKGTKIYIPIGGTSKTVEQKQDFITFISKSQIGDTVVTENKASVNLSGIKLDFNFEITPDAYCEIIFDIKSGDIIRGNGNGKIKMQIDTEGDFTMFGDYEISKGAYNFTLLNAINKEFKIKEGSRISWSGDPYGGILDINATYEQTASLFPIIKNALTGDRENPAPQYTRRYPVTVLMKLTGDLLSPDIDLGVNFDDYPQNDPIFMASILSYKSRLMTDEQELNKQVFSLLVLRRLSEEGAFSGVEGSVGSSLSELLSNQLSYWVSQAIDENLEIDMNLNTMDQNALNTLQLRLSYSMFDGRLRVTGQSDSRSMLGDWTVEYILSKDGRLKLKMFNRYNQNVVISDMSNTNMVTGVSLLHSQNFNNLKDIFSFKRKKKKQAPVVDAEEEDITTQSIPTNSTTGTTNQNSSTEQKKK
ncbi:translocation/assembly module TamB domain-containing protein [Rhodocytophaga aerolata]|uniref:Translocation/assembly module TamB domain-containing protein n=1 Tax=Rhodocytophaga aerolata TaxID=455078 RepID=A0ABT8R2Q0_9BACT|nr:translocation/assembly module TamB domain-containing protein [Rhodocytophaga aerolata]MDO1445644.1 translocation/assembly module TamB domain-containing protein [Rhodocytophaga aerolata]